MTQTKAELLETKHQGDIRLGDANSSHYVGFKAPATVGSNLVWTLPATDGSANQFLQTNASGVLSWGTADTSASMPKTGGIFTGNTIYNDGIKAFFGTGSDLSVYHDGTNSWINNTSGELIIYDDSKVRIRTNDLEVRNTANSEILLTAVDGGAVSLYFDSVKKLETTSAGIAITGAATISTDLTVTGDLTVSGTTTTINTQTLDVEDKNVVIGKVSSPSDTTADGGGWTLKGASDKTFNWVNATDAWTSSEHIHLGDNKRLLVGTGSDLEIWHDGSNSYIKDGGSGDLIIRASDQLKIQETDNGETMAVFNKDGAVDLYHNNVKKLETTSGGINVTGAIQVNGAALSSSPQITATASGSIAAGKPVIVNSNGTVSQAKEDPQPLSGSAIDASATPGSIPVPINNHRTQFDIGYDATYKIPIVVSNQIGAGNHVTIDMGKYESSGQFDPDGGSTQISGANGNCHLGGIFADPNQAGKHMVVHSRDSCSEFRAYAVTVTSATAHSAGSGYLIKSGSQCRWIHACYDDSQDRFCLIYQQGGAWYARTIQISGTSFANLGTEVTLTSSGTINSNKLGKVVFDSTNNKCVAVYQTSGDVKARVLTLASNGTISMGSEVNVASLAGTSGENDNKFTLAYSPIDERVVLFYTVDRARVKAGIVSGTSTTWNEGTYAPINTSGAYTADQKVLYSQNSGRINLLYKHYSDSKLYAQVLTFNSGSAYTLYHQVSANSHGNISGNSSMEELGVGIDPSRNQVLAIWNYSSNNSLNESNNYQDGAVGTNVTSENYIGTSSAAYANSAAATINVSGSVDSNQSSLTAGQHYYVQKNGSLGLSPASPAVYAGTAVSSTKLIVNATAPVVTPYGELIETVDLAGTQGHDFETLDWDTYLEYVIHLSNIRFVYSSGSGTNLGEHIFVRIKTTGSYLSSRYSYNQVRYRSNSGTQTSFNDSNAGQWTIASQVNRILHARLHFPRSAAATGGNVNTDAGFCQSVHGDAQCNQDESGNYNGEYFRMDGGMHSHADCQGTTTGIKLYASSNMYMATKAEARLYGIRG